MYLKYVLQLTLPVAVNFSSSTNLPSLALFFISNVVYVGYVVITELG